MPDQRLVVATDPTATFRFPALTFQWMDTCGLDRSVAMLGLAIVPRATGDSPAVHHADSLRVYEPIMPRKVAGLAGNSAQRTKNVMSGNDVDI